MTTEPARSPWRRYLRLSVRALIVLVLLIGGVLGWIVRGARIQRDAVAAITQAGGEVFYDWQWHNGLAIPGGKPPAPGWLIDTFGVDYFANVVSVDLQPEATSALLVHVQLNSRDW